jgi:hypothetical protein
MGFVERCWKCIYSGCILNYNVGITCGYSGSQSAVQLSPRAEVCKSSWVDNLGRPLSGASTGPSPVPRPQKIGTSNWVWIETYYYHIWWNKHPITSRFRVPRVLTPQIHDADWLMKLSTVLLCAWHCSPGSLLCLRLFCTLKNVFDTVVDFSRVLGTVLHCSLLCSRLFSLLSLTLFQSHLRERQSHTLRHTLPEYVL